MKTTHTLGGEEKRTSSPEGDEAAHSRRQFLKSAAAGSAVALSAAPQAVLFETFPFGRRSLRFELFPLLERIDLLLERGVLVAEPIYSGARVERPDQATRKRRNEDECDCGGSGDREAIAKPSRQEE